ncbi:MAG: hypothetical protein ACKER6_00710 [Candidatus Hodgkinia cicadicola]
MASQLNRKIIQFAWDAAFVKLSRIIDASVERRTATDATDTAECNLKPQINATLNSNLRGVGNVVWKQIALTLWNHQSKG